MDVDTSEFIDGSGRRPDEVEIYKEADDYISAYSRHTDYRIEKYGHASAIGGHWEEHGRAQLEFLKKQGLKPDSTLLDFGCGTGRLARHVVPYLRQGRYTGVDISTEAVCYAYDLAKSEGWFDQRPSILVTQDGLIPEWFLSDGLGIENPKYKADGNTFDTIWMHSVFTHLPEDMIAKITKQISQMDFGVWLFTFDNRGNPDKPVRTGLKQFCYPAEYLIGICRSVGLSAEYIGAVWEGGQSCIKVTRD